MKNSYIFLILIWAFPAKASEIWLRVGESYKIAAPRDATVRAGSRSIVRIVDEGDAIRIVALKPGVSPVSFGRRTYMVHVSLAAQKDFVLALRAMVANSMGLKLRTDSDKAEIHGTLLRFEDWRKIAELAGRYQGDYTFKAQALPDVAREALDHFTELSKRKGFPIVRFSAEPEFTVHLPKASAGLRRPVERLFHNFGIAVEMSESDLELRPLVRTRVILAEVSKSFSRELGIGWPSEYRAQLLPGFGTPDALIVSLKALEAQGQAQILASPNLSCRSGGEARFLAGGEFPIRMISRNARDVAWKQHGVILRVKPKADFQGAISLEIETEISILDMANAVDGIPALKTNSVKSHFDLAGKRTIALSGLIRQEQGRSGEGLPYLANIPILGSLFSSKRFMNHQTELVVFVTPEIHSPDADEKIEMPEGWVRDGI